MVRRLAERYALGDEIAVGGSARVHTAVDERLGRRVAVKILDGRLVGAADPGARERFSREARASARFTHPHAVAVYDAGEDAGDPFIVLELVEGPSLAHHLAEHGRLTLVEAARITLQVLSALSAAHRDGIVHRDVKPANVLLDRHGDAKLADFGIARRFDDLSDSVTATGLVMGTPRYVAPEQAAGRPVDPRADVWASGLLLQEMLVGPDAARDGPPGALDLARLRPDVPAGVRDVVARALATDPDDRFPTAAAMAAALRDAVEGAPRTAAPTRAVPTDRAVPPTRVLPTEPPSRSRWWPAVVGALLLGALVAGIVALAARDDGLPTDGTEAGASGPATSTPTTAAASAPATTTPPSAAVATVPPTVATTVPPTAPAVAELIPGFPVVADLTALRDQLAADPGVVGPRGPELLDGVEQVLDANGAKKRSDRAVELWDDVYGWAQAGELDPAVAGAVIDLVAPLVDQRGNDD